MSDTYIIGTCDTKAAELYFIQSTLADQGVQAKIIDVSTQRHSHHAEIPNIALIRDAQSQAEVLDGTDRGKSIQMMAEALREYLTQLPDIRGIMGIGGSGGTSLITYALRALPVGIPKIVVSTMASGNTRPFVEATDIILMPSITDLAGLNSISRRILTNAAHALAGMIHAPLQDVSTDKPALGLTMFGVTTPCVQHIRQQMEQDYDCIVFHATGIGGQSMEKLIASGMMRHVIDVTLTEICDLLMGGILSAGEARMDSVIETRIPYVGSVGALDMVNFGPMDTVPQPYQHRNLYRHNAQVTLMRTTTEENVRMGKWLAVKLNQMEGPVRFLLPEKGVSLIDVPGKPFHDPEADQALFNTLKAEMIQTDQKKLISLPYEINDPAFAEALVASFNEIHHTS